MTVQSTEPAATVREKSLQPVPSTASGPADKSARPRRDEAEFQRLRPQSAPATLAAEFGSAGNSIAATDQVAKLTDSAVESREAVQQGAVGRSAPSAAAPTPSAFTPRAPAPAETVHLADAGSRRERAKVMIVTLEEAVKTLGGTIRLVDGMVPARVEAVESIELGSRQIRVVYLDPPGRELWLDQEVPAETDQPSAGALANGARLLTGDTLALAGPGGRQTLSWLDQTGVQLGLTGYLPADSLRGLARRIH